MDTEKRGAGSVDGSGRVDPDTLERFLDRVGSRVETNPVPGSAIEQRNRVVKLLGTMGAMSYYELLGLKPDCSDAQIYGAFDELGRLVHPANAAKLKLEGKESTLTLLFERLTEAYLALSDPKRRSTYDFQEGIAPKTPTKSRDKLEEERKESAQKLFLQARGMVSTQEYHYAVEMLKEAVRLDPCFEYLVLLGEVQSRNPRWLRHAEDSFRRALKLDANDPGLRVNLGKLYEKMELLEKAETEYRAALDLMPGHPLAEEGLQSLKDAASGGQDGKALKKLARWLKSD